MARPATPIRTPAPRKVTSRNAGGPRPAPKASAADTIDTRIVRDLADMLAATDLTEIEVEKGDLRIRVARGGTAVAAPAAPVSVSVAAPAPAVVTTTPAKPADHPGVIKSPMVGTAYRRPSPDAKPFVEIGSTVAAGDRVILVEAMKTFNEIVAPRGGTVTAVLVEDGQPVEFDQALLIVE